MTFLARNADVILQQSLQKLQKNTGLTATNPGSVLRSIVEVITKELGDFYQILDFNDSQAFISTANGRSLDLIGSLFNVARKQLSNTASIDQQLGVFYFYIDAPYSTNITIRAGTRVSTESTLDSGPQFVYVTTETVVIPAGRTKVYAALQPLDADSAFAAGPNTLTINSFDETREGVGVDVKCINPKPIPAIIGYESDNDYRVRIVKEVRRAAGGTADAVRFAGLGIPGVRDITVRSTPYGLGTMEVLVVPESNVLLDNLITSVTEQIQLVRPVGVRIYVKAPEFSTVEVTAQLVLTPDAPIGDPRSIARRAEIAVIRYINRLLVGTPLIYNQLVQSVIDASEFIADVSFSTLSVNGAQILRRNYTPPEDTQLIPGAINAIVST